MRAGKLRNLVRIQSCSGSSDGQGGTTNTWSDVATVWAGLESALSREFVAAKQVRPEMTHLVRMRYRADVAPSCRLILGSRVLGVVSANDVEERHRELLVTCTELVGETP